MLCSAAVNKTGESISELILSFKDHCCAMIQAKFSSKSTKHEKEIWDPLKILIWMLKAVEFNSPHYEISQLSSYSCLSITVFYNVFQKELLKLNLPGYVWLQPHLSIENTSKHASILCWGSVQFVFVFETCCAVPPSTRQGNQFQNWFFHSKTTAAPWYKRNSVQRARNVKKKKKRFALCYYFAQLWDITSRWVSALLSEQ